MKSMVIFATVLLICQAAKVPQEVTHQVTVPVPSNVLAALPLSSTIKPLDTEIPAIVKEVTKNQKPVTDKPTLVQERKPNMMNKMPAHRSMRSVVMEQKTVVPVSRKIVTPNPVIKAVETDISTIDPCDLLCTKFEFEPICATNGLCLHEFPNQCILETYNCKHKSDKFTATKDDRCQMHWLTKCEESEMI